MTEQMEALKTENERLRAALCEIALFDRNTFSHIGHTPTPASLSTAVDALQDTAARALGITPYHCDGIPGGHECELCHEVNTCYQVSGYMFPDSAGDMVHVETLECDQCGHRHVVRW